MPTNLKRIAQSKPQGGMTILADNANAPTVLCAQTANSVGGRFESLLSGAKRFVMAAVPQSACTSFAPAAPAGGVPSDSQLPCSDDKEFAPTTSPEQALVSRHVDCRRATSDGVYIYVPLSQKSPGSFTITSSVINPTESWSGYSAGKVAGFETKITTSGAADKLSKRHHLQVRALGYTANADYPGPRVSQVVVRPKLSCASLDQSDAKCSYTAPNITVPLNGQWSSQESFDVSFSWTKVESSPVDAVRFLVENCGC
jgi:hypothetical protein